MIKIICVGKIKENYLKEAVKDYMTRLSKYTNFKIIEINDSNIKEEAVKILANIKKEYVISLDIEGNLIDSKALSKMISNLFLNSISNITFVIGSSNGLDEMVKKRSNYSLSLSKMTFPYQLFRVILLEQIYRCFKIINNEAYHK